MPYTYTLEDLLACGASYTKQQLSEMSKEEFYDLKQECYDSDYYEFLDHFRGQRSISIAWQEYDKETKVFVTPEMMFENEEFKFNSYSEYRDYLAEIENLRLYEKQLQNYFEYHHIQKEPEPYYQICINKIESALKKL